MSSEQHAPSAGEYITHHLQHLQKNFAFESVKQSTIVDFSLFNLDSLVFATVLGFLGVFLLWLGTFFQLVLLVADDMRRVPQEFVEVARTVGANSRQVMTDVALRSMGPTLIDNLRITLGWCWTYLIIAEIVAADSGIGYVIWTARRFVKTPEVMAGVVVIGLIGLVTDQLLRLLHRRLFRYL